MDYTENARENEPVMPGGMAYGPVQGGSGPAKKKKRKRIFIFLIILGVILLLAAAASRDRNHGTTRGSSTYLTAEDTLDLNKPYVGILHVEGTISESSSGSLIDGDSAYHHQFLLGLVDDMIKDRDNKGILLYLDTPGGSVYASDEMYLKLMEYRKKTGRPVYAYMASEAASGGYYISSAAEKIIANRNCWTGSIGVLIGTIYDVSGLLKKLGISPVNVTSGKNKTMGSSTEKMTGEQREIFQGLVNEAYDQFVGVVAEGREMQEKKVRKLADGRIYTAKQALNNGLVDEIDGYEEAKALMKKDKELRDSSFQELCYSEDSGMFSSILGSLLSGKSAGRTENKDRETAAAEEGTSGLQKLMENNSFTISYMSNVRK